MSRLGRRREVPILLAVALFLLATLSTFTLFTYRNAVAELQAERRQEALETAERMAAAIGGNGGATAEELRRAVPHALRVALLAADGRAAAEAGTAGEGDRLAPFRGLDLSRPQAVGPTGPAPGTLAALAPVRGRSPARYVRVDLRAGRLAVEVRRVRLLSWIVLPVNAVLLALVLFHLRSFLAPWESILERASAVRPERGDEEDEVAFLVRTFERALEQPPEDAAASVEEDIAALQRTLGSSLESGLLLLDRNARVVSLNAVGGELLGQPAPPAGTPLQDALRPHAELLEVVREVVGSHGSAHRREVEIYRHGETRTLGLTAHPLRRDDGSVRGFLVLFADLTEARRRAEEEQLSTSLAQVGELAAGLAHEMRNSLATLRGYLKLVERAPDEESITDYLSEIRRESDHLQRVLEDFLSFARPGSTRLETFDLKVVARRAAADPALAGMPVELTCDPALDADLKGDPQLLERAVRNLLHNAAEAEREAGREGPLLVELARRDDGLALHIEDHGRGVPEELRQRLFQPFATAGTGGVGLGLALARRIVDLHGGRLTLDPRPGGGTRAELLFPGSPDRGTSPARPA